MILRGIGEGRGEGGGLRCGFSDRLEICGWGDWGCGEVVWDGCGMVVGCNSDTEGGVEIGSTRWMVEMKV